MKSHLLLIATVLITSIACKKEILAPTVQVVADKVTKGIVTFPDTIILDGSQSKDPQNLSLSYQWRIVAGSAGATIAAPTKAVTFLTVFSAGKYEVELTVTNDRGKSEKRTKIIQVVQIPVPEVYAGVDQTIYAPRNSTSLDGHGSRDVFDYLWIQIAGNPGAEFSHIGSSETIVYNLKTGINQLELNAFNRYGIRVRDTVQITVINPVPANGQIIFPEQPASCNWECSLYLEKITDFLPAGAVIKEVFTSKPDMNNWVSIPNYKNNPNSEYGYSFDEAIKSLTIIDSFGYVIDNEFMDIKVTYY